MKCDFPTSSNDIQENCENFDIDFNVLFHEKGPLLKKDCENLNIQIKHLRKIFWKVEWV